MNPFNNNKNKTTSSDRIAKLKAATIIKNTPLSKKYNSYNQKINYTNNALNQTCDKTCTYDISKNIFQGKNNIYNKFKDFSNPSCNNNIETYTKSVIKNLNNKNIHAGNAKVINTIENLVTSSTPTPSESEKNKQSDPAVMEILDLMTRQPKKFIKNGKQPLFDTSHVRLYFDLSFNYNLPFVNNVAKLGNLQNTNVKTPSFEHIRPGPDIEFIRIDISGLNSDVSASYDISWAIAEPSSNTLRQSSENYYIIYRPSCKSSKKMVCPLYNIELGIPGTDISNDTYDVKIAGWNSWAIKPPSDNSGTKGISGEWTFNPFKIGASSETIWYGISEDKGTPDISSVNMKLSTSKYITLHIIVNKINSPTEYGHITLKNAKFIFGDITSNKIGFSTIAGGSSVKNISNKNITSNNKTFDLSFSDISASNPLKNTPLEPGMMFDLSLALQNSITDSSFSDPFFVGNVYTLLPDSSNSNPGTFAQCFDISSSAINKFKRISSSTVTTIGTDSYYINPRKSLSFKNKVIEFETTDPCNNPNRK